MDRIEEDHAGDPEANLDDLLHTESDHEENMTISSREAMPPRTTNTGQAAPASLPDLALLTSAIVNLNNLLTAKQPSTSGETSSSNTLKRKNPSDHGPPAKKHASQAASAMMANPHDEGECDGLLNQLLNSDAPPEDVDSTDVEQEAEDELLSQLNKEYESEDAVGDEIANTQLAKLVTKMFRSKMADKTLQEKMDRHARPANCDAAKPTRVNAGIYRRLGEYTKKRDFNLYKIQQVLIKGIIPVIKIADLCMSGNLIGEKGQQAKRLALESLSLLTHTNYELNIQRKLFMKPDIGKDYTALCSPHVPFTDWLFGDDLQKQLKDIGDENKIGARVLPSHKSSYGNSGNFNNNNNFHKASKNFRGQSFHKRKKNTRGGQQWSQNRPQKQ